jgi:WD40 repeat protein
MRPFWIAIVMVSCAAAQTGGHVLTADSDVFGVAFTKDGANVAGLSSDNRVRLWDAHTGAVGKTVAIAADERFSALPTGTNLVAVTAKDGAMELRDLETGLPSKRFPAVSRASRRRVVSMSTPGAALVAGSNRVDGNSRDEVMRLWDPSGKERFAVPAGIGGTSSMAVSPDGKLLAAGSYDTDMRVWNTRDGELVGHINDVLVATFAMEFTPDGKFLVTGGVDRTLRFWDTSTWKLERQLKGQPEMISALAIAPGGRLIATGGFSEFTQENPVKVLLWDSASNQVVRSFDAPRIVSSLAFSPDGKVLAVACGKKSVQLWNLEVK